MKRSAPVQSRRSWARRLIADSALDQALLERLWRDPNALVKSGEMMKDGDRCTLVRLTSAGRRFVLKRYNRRGWVHTAAHWLLRSRARWCWLNAGRVRDANLLTPRNLAMLETRFGPLRDRSFLLHEYIEGQMLLDAAHDPTATAQRLDALAIEFARIWRSLGRARLGHRDMKATNFIVDQQDRIWLIDLDGMRVHRSKWLFARRRRKDLERFMRNWHDRPEAARAFRARIDTIEPPAGV